MVILPLISIGFLSAARVILPPSKVMFLLATRLFWRLPSIPATWFNDILPPVAFKVKSLSIVKAVRVEPSLLNLKLDPSEALKF